MVVFTFSVFYRKYPSWANLVQKIKIVCSKWNMIQRLIQICRIQCCIHVICLEISFLGKFDPKNQNCQLKLKSGTQTNLNTKNSVLKFIFSVFDWKYPSFWKFVPKIKTFCWSSNLDSKLIWICRLRWWFSFFLDRKYPPWFNLVQKFKIVSLRRNLVSRLNWICKILWWCSLFLF